MKELIEALKIFMKYKDMSYPIHCERDVLYVRYNKKELEISEQDVKRLDELGFFWDEDQQCFQSFRFGSC